MRNANSDYKSKFRLQKKTRENYYRATNSMMAIAYDVNSLNV